MAGSTGATPAQGVGGQCAEGLADVGAAQLARPDEEVRERRPGADLRVLAARIVPREAVLAQHPLLEGRHPAQCRGIREVRRLDPDVELTGDPGRVLQLVEIADRPDVLGRELPDVGDALDLGAEAAAEDRQRQADAEYPLRVVVAMSRTRSSRGGEKGPPPPAAGSRPPARAEASVRRSRRSGRGRRRSRRRRRGAGRRSGPSGSGRAGGRGSPRPWRGTPCRWSGRRRRRRGQPPRRRGRRPPRPRRSGPGTGSRSRRRGRSGSAARRSRPSSASRRAARRGRR